jgi:hypothetical protein
LERQADDFRDEVSELRKETDIWRTTDESRRKARQEAEDIYKLRLMIALAVLAVVVAVAVLVLAALVYDRLAVVAGLLLASGQHEAFMNLCRTEMGRHIIEREDHRILEKLLYVRQPVSQDSSTYELLPRNVEALRKGLFTLIGSDDFQTATFAAEYLSCIDLSRAEEGTANNGVRHPDIKSGRPWPVVSFAVEPTSVYFEKH